MADYNESAGLAACRADGYGGTPQCATIIRNNLP
jgi:hypothetical protein